MRMRSQTDWLTFCEARFSVEHDARCQAIHTCAIGTAETASGASAPDHKHALRVTVKPVLQQFLESAVIVGRA